VSITDPDGQTLSEAALAATTGIVITGMPQIDDTLTVDLSGGAIPFPITFHGGQGGYDTLVIEGGCSSSGSYSASGSDTGTILLDGATIHFTGLEPVIDDSVVDDRVFTITTVGVDQQIRIGDDGDLDNGYSTIDSNGTGGFESITFPNPINSLTIYAGNGNDTIILDTPDNGFTAAIVVSGEDGIDTVNIDAALDPASIDVCVDAEVINDLPLVTLSLSGTSLAESGPAVTVTTTLDRATSNEVTVNLAFGGTADGSDYAASASQVQIVPGALSGEITLTGFDDTLVEPDETVIVRIDSTVNAVEEAEQEGQATILNDDSATLSISDVVVTEGEGTTFTVTLDKAVDAGVTVDFATSDGSALAGADYTAAAGTLLFAGVAGETQRFTVGVADEDLWWSSTRPLWPLCRTFRPLAGM